MAIGVLIVEDEFLLRADAAEFMENSGFTVYEASNADEAVALMQRGGIDLAVLDFNMPGRNGLDLAEILRAKHPDLPIALATANVQDELIARARAIGAAFIAKPVTEDAVRGFLSGVALKLRAAGR